MTEQTTISKEETSTLDYDELRKKALEHIEELAGETWTDYNTHDPGITILESLIYALTDLSYRTNLSMEDLLASNPTEGFAPSLFRAEAILSAHPLTLEDTKKQLLGIPDIQNVWIYKVKKGRKQIFFNSVDNHLQESATNNAIELSGLCDVEIECIDGQDSDTILTNIKSVLNRDRNLCEDFAHVRSIYTKELTVHATVILSLESDVNEVLAHIYFRIYKFLNPKRVFDSLENLQENKILLDEIYEGPLLSQGFLRDDSFKTTGEEDIIYFSDVLAAMWSSGAEEDILSIDYLIDDNALLKTPVTDESENNLGFLTLGESVKPILDIDNSDIQVFFETKEDQSGNALFDIAVVKERYDELKESYVEQVITKRTDLNIPEGTQKKITEYVSVQEELPRVYGVGNYVPPASVSSPERLAKSKQLQGFLLLFDQLMGNYLAQLSLVGSLFSYESQQCTYFSQVLGQITGIRGLLHEYSGTSDSDWDNFITTTFSETLQQITEFNKSNLTKRRHQFLDHLLARFSDAYTDVANFQDTDQVLGQNAIAAKEQLLGSYDQLSKQRGKGFNYGGSTMWGSGSEVTGYEQWVRAKLGISNTTRNSICPSENFFDRLQFGQNAADAVSIDFDSYYEKTSWTLELWVLPSETTTSGTLIDLQNTSSENIIRLEINNSADLVVKLATESQVTIPNTAIQWDQWVQLAISYDQTTPTATIFINGNETQDITLSDTIPSFANSTVILGNNATKNAVLKGGIAQLLLWGKALSESEIIENTRDTSLENNAHLHGFWKAENAEETTTFNNQKNGSVNHVTIEGTPQYQGIGTNNIGTFHLVEHILLRPKNANSLHFLTPSFMFDNDPYSNQMTIICPKLAPPFNNRGYRDHFTHIVQSEAPAHVYVNILWVIYPSELSQFESHYREWLEAQQDYLANPTISLKQERYRIAHENFIGTFNELNLTYASY